MALVDDGLGVGDIVDSGHRAAHDDGNAFVDDVHGYDFANDDGNPFDDHGLGTYWAGSVGAEGNNGVGIPGVTWSVSLMAVKYIGSSGSGSTDGQVSALMYAVDNGARVILDTSDTNVFSQAVADAIEAAGASGILVVTGASGSLDSIPRYPASLLLDNILSPTPMNRFDARYTFGGGTSGLTSVDLGTPGEDNLSTVPTGFCNFCDPSGYDYALLGGAGVAAAHAAGIAALALSSDLTLTERGLKNLLMDTVDPLPALDGLTVTGGRANLFSPVACVPISPSVRVSQPGHDFRVDLGATIAVRADVTSCGLAVSDAEVDVVFDNGDTSLTLFDDGLHDDLAAGDGVFGNPWTPSVTSDVSLDVVATSPTLGQGSDSRTGPRAHVGGLHLRPGAFRVD